MRIVVTGGSGMLGHCLMRVARQAHEVWGSYHTHAVNIPGCSMFPLDVTNEAEVRGRLKPLAPEAVIHTAALTDVDECERSPETARRINSGGTKIVATISEELVARFVYISTDYVFDGRRGDYREDDQPNPVNQYGKSKLLGEEAARANCSQSLIIRTSMYGWKLPPRIGMMEGLVAALRAGKPMTRFVDQHSTPLYTGQLSEIILRLVELAATGLFHVGAMEKVSRYEFSRQVAALFAAGCAQIQPVPFRQIDGLAQRPQDTSLRSQTIQQRLGIEVPRLRPGLIDLKRDLEEPTKEGTVSR